MRLYDVLWKNVFVEKILRKHDVTTDEVEEVLFDNPHIRFAKKGHVKHEDLYVAYGHTAAGTLFSGVLYSKTSHGRVTHFRS